MSKKQNPALTVYRDHIFNDTYEKVWAASEKAISNYQIEQSNMESGVITTEWVKGDQVWVAPHVDKKPSAGMRAKITLYLTKGKIQSSQATKVQIKKDLEIHKDFLQDPEKLNSDGLEETTILYRIERELEMARAQDAYGKRNK